MKGKTVKSTQQVDKSEHIGPDRFLMALPEKVSPDPNTKIRGEFEIPQFQYVTFIPFRDSYFYL